MTTTVAVCTYGQDKDLMPLIAALDGRSCVDRVLIIDNNEQPRIWPEDLVDLVGPDSFCWEPGPSVAAARNRALSECEIEAVIEDELSVLVFIDDDELPGPIWPWGQVKMMKETGAALVGGPVLSMFTHQIPEWINRGGFFERPSPPDVARCRWLRTGNLAIDVAQVREAGIRFDTLFEYGEDVAFSMSCRRAGLDLVWCESGGYVAELVGPERTNLPWLKNRAKVTTAAYVQALLLGSPRPLIRLLALASGAIRVVESVVRQALGAVTGHEVYVMKARVLRSKGFGQILGAIGAKP